MEHPLTYYLTGLSIGVGISGLVVGVLNIFSAVRHLDGEL